VLAVYITEEKWNNSWNNNSNSWNWNWNWNNSKTTLYYYIKNHLGTPIALTDDKGKIVEEYETDEFGIVSTGKNSKLNNIFFTGKIYDKEIWLYYYNFRYYNPELGRFINRDPIWIIDDINLYVYVGNNPLKWTDPWGLEAKNMLVEKYIISIFDLAVENTKWANIIVFYEWTKTNWAFDLKNNLYLRSVASKNWWVIDFNWANVTPANLGNLLAGMNMENMYLSNSITKNIFYLYEVNAAYKEWYWKNSVGIAFFDEYADNIWYDEWISIFDKYTKTSILDEKINIITNSINKLNDEFYYRDDLETKVRRYYNITK
jgi:RHS repeat-associated protein